MDNTSVRLHQRIRVRPLLERPYTPTVSVVISCYNYAHYLPQAVQSCLDQLEVDVDVIIVDDASTDNSLAVAQGLAAAHANISVVAHSQNKGMVETFNDGAKTATGEFLVRLDADDLLTPGSLARATLVAQNYPSVGLVYGHPIHFSGGTPPAPQVTPSSWTIWPGLNWLGDRCRSGQNVITSPEALMRRSVVESVGYQANLRHTPDMEFWFRMSAFSDVAYIHGADQAWHRDHPDSMSAREVDGVVDLGERLEAFEALFGGVAGSVSGAYGLLGVAKRALVSEALYTAGLELDRGLRHPELIDAYLRFARQVNPGVECSAEWIHLSTRVSKTSSANPWRLSSIVRRTHSRVRSELNWHRWRRNGVF